MALEQMGKRIAALRKEKGVRQEDLAAFAGVTAQAVSKWERGGVPDTELLPVIADYFDVSIDTLFGRSSTKMEDVHLSLQKCIAGEKREKRFAAAMEYCWDVEMALWGHVGKDLLSERTKKMRPDSQTYSSVIDDDGFTRMGIGNRLQYFFLMPDVQNKDKALLEGVDYPAFFSALGDKDVFNACVMLHKRESQKAFTKKMLMREMGISEAKAKEVIMLLQSYHLLSATPIETEEEVQVVYQFRPTASFAAFLVFAREMIQPPNNFCYYMSSGGKPYL